MADYDPPYPVLFDFTGTPYTPPLSGAIVMEFDNAVGPVDPDPGATLGQANFLMLLPM